TERREQQVVVLQAREDFPAQYQHRQYQAFTYPFIVQQKIGELALACYRRFGERLQYIFVFGPYWWNVSMTHDATGPSLKSRRLMRCTVFWKASLPWLAASN